MYCQTIFRFPSNLKTTSFMEWTWKNINRRTLRWVPSGDQCVAIVNFRNAEDYLLSKLIYSAHIEKTVLNPDVDHSSPELSPVLTSYVGMIAIKSSGIYNIKITVRIE